MTLPAPSPLDPVVPDAYDRTLAQTSSRTLKRLLDAHDDVRVRLLENGDAGPVLTLPASALHLLLRLLTEMAQGHAVTLVPHHAELTTQQAADLLHVSRPYLIKLLEQGEVPHHKVGTHRRVRFEDVLAYKRRVDQARLATLEELAAVSQDLGLDE